MQQTTLVIQNQQGMHARAARVFVKVASQFRSEIKVRRDDLVVDGKSILGVMMLAAEPGAEIEVSASGPDEAEALEAIRQVVDDKFGEE
jgi:phosphocarrier protein